MANTDIVRDVISDTSGKIRFMLVSIFGTEESAEDIMKQIYTEFSTASKAPTEKDIYKKTAEICFRKLGKPGNANPTEFPIEDMRSFFDSCENFDRNISKNSINDIDILNGILDSLEPIAKLTVFLRMYLGMSTDEIAKSAGVNEKSIVICLFCAYRSIMPSAAKICSAIPSLMGQPILQLIRLSLLKMSASTTPSTITACNPSDTIISEHVDMPAIPVAQAPTAQPAPSAVAFPDVNYGPMFEPPTTLEMKAAQMAASMPVSDVTPQPELNMPMFKPATSLQNPTEPVITAEPEPVFVAPTVEPAPSAVAFPEVNYGPVFDTPAATKTPTEPVITAEPEPVFVAPTVEPAPSAVAFPEVNYGPVFDTPAATETPTEPEPVAEPEPVFVAPTVEPAATISNIYNNIQPPVVSNSAEWEYVKNKFGFDVSDDLNAKLSNAYQLISKGYTDQAKQLLFSINREAPHAASFLGLLMIEVSAVTPEDMLNIAADYSSLPLFNATDYYANSQLKDFLNTLLRKNTPPTPIAANMLRETSPTPSVLPAQYTQPELPAKPAKEKKSKTGLWISIIIIIAFLAIAGVAYYAISTGLITLPWQNDNNDKSPATSENTTVAETATENVVQPEIVRLDIGTSTVTIDRSKSNKFEFRPTQAGYYVFSSEETDIDLDSNLFIGTERIANDFDSGDENNFMMAVYCEAYTPMTLTVAEKVKSSGEANVKITVYQLDEDDGKAYTKYTEYSTNGITVTTDDILYLDHTLTATRVPISQDANVFPIDFYIDKAEETLWVALPGATKNSNDDVTLWYPVKYR